MCLCVRQLGPAELRHTHHQIGQQCPTAPWSERCQVRTHPPASQGSGGIATAVTSQPLRVREASLRRGRPQTRLVRRLKCGAGPHQSVFVEYTPIHYNVMSCHVMPQPLLVHHENRRVGPAEDFGQVRMGVPHLPKIFRSASSAGCMVRGPAVARSWALELASRYCVAVDMYSYTPNPPPPPPADPCDGVDCGYGVTLPSTGNAVQKVCVAGDGGWGRDLSCECPDGHKVAEDKAYCVPQ